jgi:hypothetical protein
MTLFGGRRLRNYLKLLPVKLIAFICYNSHPAIHYYFAYIYVCLYVQIAIRLLGFTLEEFGVQSSDIPSVWYLLKYDMLSEFYSSGPQYFCRVEFESVNDALGYVLGLDLYLGFSLFLFPYFISFVSLF